MISSASRFQLHHKVFLAGVVAVVGLSLASFVGLRVLYRQAERESLREADKIRESVVLQLETNDVIYSQLVGSAMKVLLEKVAATGPAKLGEGVTVNGVAAPNLRLGAYGAANDFALVDQIKALTGSTATLFVRNGDQFLRVSTNVQKPDGSRAVGTALDPNGAAFAAVNQGRAFYGLVNILGKPYLTGYEPLRGTDGAVVGVAYVGYPLTTMSRLEGVVGSSRILDHGFVALVDAKGKVVMHSGHVEAGQVETLLDGSVSANEGWTIARDAFPAWNYQVVSGISAGDIRTKALHLTAKVFGVVALGIVLILVILGLFYRESRTLMASLRQIGLQLDSSSGTLNETAMRVAEASESVATTATEEAAALEQSSASIEEMSSISAANGSRMESAQRHSGDTRLLAETGAAEMIRMREEVRTIQVSGDEMIAAMRAIQSSSSSISKIMKTIDEIAFQTNILALNAAVEAARAGAAGAGFAVVADEVRNLAQRSADASHETARLIEDSIRKSENGTKISTRVAEQMGKVIAQSGAVDRRLQEIVEKMKETDRIMQEVGSATREQNIGFQQVGLGVQEMARLTQTNAAHSQDTARVSQRLQEEACQLRGVISDLLGIMGGALEAREETGGSARRLERHAAPALKN